MKQPIRVAMIIQGYHPCIGGAERQLAAVAPLLQAEGVEVHILTRRFPGLKPFEIIEGIHIHRLPIPGPKAVKSFVFTVSALLLLRRLRADIIHAHELFSPTTTALFAKFLYRIPVVVKLLRGGKRGDLDRLSEKVFGRQRTALFARTIDAFVTISSEIDAELARIKVPEERRPFIPNGVDIDKFRPGSVDEKRHLRDQLNLPAGPIVIFTGRLSPEKNIDRLIEIWPQIRMQSPDALLLIVGAGPEEEALKQRASAGVRFAGRIEDVAPFLRAADVFVLPSATEGLSNALLEAMSTGLAAVVTAVGGAPDVIEHGRHGLLIQPNDTSALLEGVVMLLKDGVQRETIGQAARERIIDEYALSSTARRLRELYDRLLVDAYQEKGARADLGSTTG